MARRNRVKSLPRATLRGFTRFKGRGGLAGSRALLYGQPSGCVELVEGLIKIDADYYGKAVPDLDFTKRASVPLIEPLTVTSCRKFAALNAFPD